MYVFIPGHNKFFYKTPLYAPQVNELPAMSIIFWCSGDFIPLHFLLTEFGKFHYSQKSLTFYLFIFEYDKNIENISDKIYWSAEDQFAGQTCLLIIVVFSENGWYILHQYFFNWKFSGKLCFYDKLSDRFLFTLHGVLNKQTNKYNN